MLARHPLKAIGHDEVHHRYRGAADHLRRVDRDVAKWDYLVSPSPACTRTCVVVLRRSGPRDRIPPQRRPLAGRRVDPPAGPAQLGLAEHTTAVLYAPTWRDDSRGPDGLVVQPNWLDLERLQQGLPETVLLARLHPNVRSGAAHRPGFTFDVGSHPDINELYLAADVLVSDYSSAIYDFAVTGKPIVLFAPDLEHYRGDVRPFYFDYEEWAPGPVTATTDELLAALADLGATRRDAAERYRRFRETFCPLDDGYASERVVAAAFS